MASGDQGKHAVYQQQIAQAQDAERQGIVQMLHVNRQNYYLLAQKTWETQFGSCTNEGQKAIFDSFRSEWFSAYSEIGIAETYEEYVTRWNAKANRMSISASLTGAITGQLSIGFAFNMSLGYALFGNEYGHTEQQVLNILDYIDKILGALSEHRPSGRGRSYRGPKFPRERVSGFGRMLDSGLGESLGGGRISVGGGEGYFRGRFASARGYATEGSRSSSRRGYETAERRTGSRALIGAEERAGVAAARRTAVRYVLRYGRYFIL